jgi:hypothetical protein
MSDRTGLTVRGRCGGGRRVEQPVAQAEAGADDLDEEWPGHDTVGSYCLAWVQCIDEHPDPSTAMPPGTTLTSAAKRVGRSR